AYQIRSICAVVFYGQALWLLSKLALHEGDVLRPIELPSNIVKHTGCDEAECAVQRNRRRIVASDDGDHLLTACLAACVHDSLQQTPAQPATGAVRTKI